MLALAGPALALAPSGRHDNIIHRSRLKMEREGRAVHAARKAAAFLAEARRQAAAAAHAEAPAEPTAPPRISNIEGQTMC